MGDRDDLRGGVAAPGRGPGRGRGRRCDAPPARGRGRVREPAARRGRGARRPVLAHDGATARRGGPELLRGTRPQDRREGDEGRARARPRERPGASGVSRGRGLPPARRLRRGRARGHRQDVLVGAREGARGRPAARPLRRHHARQRRRGDRVGAAVRGRQRVRDRGLARRQGPGKGHGPDARRGAGVAGGGVSTHAATGIERRFGPYGGRYVPETLIPALDELERAWLDARDDPAFRAELSGLLRDYAGRPTPLYLARRLSAEVGHDVWLKREDLLHTGSHKINNALGQSLLARRMGKRRLIAETGAGQHGVGTATAAALLDLECVVYMGSEDIRRQQPNVQRMKMLGATVVPVESGARTLKEAVSEAIRDWVGASDETYYVIGSAVGPAPYPVIVRDLQRVIGDEAREQILSLCGRLPERVIACVGGGSNAIGTFVPFVGDASVRIVGVEAGGEGLDTLRHGAPLATGARGILHGALSAVLQDEQGQVVEAHSISAGLDYPGSGPEHAWLRDSGRVSYEAVTDDEAVAAFKLLARLEGIVPALESSHALAWLLANPAGSSLDLVTLSGRGDKDLAEVLGDQ